MRRVNLCGAAGGMLFAGDHADERFAFRSARMTSGLGYFLDEDGLFPAKVDREIVSIQRVVSPVGEAQLKARITAQTTRDSLKAKQILEHWVVVLPIFWQVVLPSKYGSAEAASEVKELVEA